jgi:hypothetical protein
MESARDACKRLYNFSEWGGAGGPSEHGAASTVPMRPDVQFFVRGHTPPASLIEGDTRHVELLVEAPGHARCTQAIWCLPAARGHGQVRIDTHEAPTAAQARDMLLGLLAQVQYPLERWHAEGAPGELAFAAPHGGCVAFVRGNLAALVTSVGRTCTGLAAEASQRFDASLMARPSARPLRVGSLDAAQLPPAFKAFLSGGQPVRERKNRRVRAAADAAPAEPAVIEAYPLGPPPPGARRVVVEAHPDP